MRALSELSALAARCYAPSIVLCVTLSAPTALGDEISGDGVDWKVIEQQVTAVCGKGNLKNLSFKLTKDSGEDEFHTAKFQVQCKTGSARCSSDSDSSDNGCFLPPKDSSGPLPNARRQAVMAMCGKDGVKSASFARAESDTEFRVDWSGISITDKSVTIETSIECKTGSDSGSDS